MVYHPGPFRRVIALYANGIDARYLTVTLTPLAFSNVSVVSFDEFSDAGLAVIGGFSYSDAYTASVSIGGFNGATVKLTAGSIFDGNGRTEPANRDLLTGGIVPLPTIFSKGPDDFADPSPSDGHGAVAPGWDTQSGSDIVIPGLSAGYKSGGATVKVFATPFAFPHDKYNPFYPSPPPGPLKQSGGYISSASAEYGSLEVTPTGIVYDGTGYTVIGARLQSAVPHVGTQASFICERNS